MSRRLAILLMLLWPLAGLAQDGDVAPEAATGRVARAVVAASRHMVVAAHPLAAEAGRDILRQGGSAADAAIATALVLGLVEPQSSGLGGGGFLLHFDGKNGAVTSFDGREAAPAAARPDRFLDAEGRPLDFFDAVVGGRSVGVPGLARLLEVAHRKHGRLPWRVLFEPALRLAEDGFPVSDRLHRLLADDPYLRRDPAARALYYRRDGSALAVGDILRNRAYADTLRLLARQGADAFYRGAFAAALVRAAASDLTLADLAGYRARERPPVCRPYRIWLICGMGPPSSGGMAVAQMLAILEPLDLGVSQDAAFAHALAEAGRLAYADRARYGADPDFVPVPVEELLDPAYLRARAALIRPDRSLGEAPAGEVGRRWGQPQGPDVPGTTHLSVVDGDGNAVALTASIENSFGARILVGGLLLNNELTDFSFVPWQGGRPVANRVEGGKRPLSAMAPTLVLDRHGRLVAALGSPGGSFIINYVARTLIGLLDWRLDPQQAVDLPNLGSRNGPTLLEAGTPAEALAPELEARGHSVRITELTSGLHAILTTSEGLLGGADSRREGAAAGD